MNVRSLWVFSIIPNIVDYLELSYLLFIATGTQNNTEKYPTIPQSFGSVYVTF